MDYKEKYTREDALRDMRSFMGQLTEGCQDALKVLIPELAESEEERVRKDLMVEIQSWEGIPESKRREYIAYLEKQKEQKLDHTELSYEEACGAAIKYCLENLI